jgi:hypothetical protein
MYEELGGRLQQYKDDSPGDVQYLDISNTESNAHGEIHRRPFDSLSAVEVEIRRKQLIADSS